MCENDGDAGIHVGYLGLCVEIRDCVLFFKHAQFLDVSVIQFSKQTVHEQVE